MSNYSVLWLLTVVATAVLESEVPGMRVKRQDMIKVLRKAVNLSAEDESTTERTDLRIAYQIALAAQTVIFPSAVALQQEPIVWPIYKLPYRHLLLQFSSPLPCDLLSPDAAKLNGHGPGPIWGLLLSQNALSRRRVYYNNAVAYYASGQVLRSTWVGNEACCESSKGEDQHEARALLCALAVHCIAYLNKAEVRLVPVTAKEADANEGFYQVVSTAC